MNKLKKKIVYTSSISMIILFLCVVMPRLFLIGIYQIAHSETKDPVLYEIPKELQIKKIDSNNRIIHYDNIEFTSPYHKLVSTKNSSTGIAYVFDDGHKIMINKMKIDTYDVQANLTLKQQKYLHNILGDENSKSSFELMKKIYMLTPDDLSYFASLNKITLKKELLAFKRIFIPCQDSDSLYCFDTNYIKGFQYGDPQNSKIIIIQIFIENKNCTLSLVGDNINQNDIDSILSTINITNK